MRAGMRLARLPITRDATVAAGKAAECADQPFLLLVERVTGFRSAPAGLLAGDRARSGIASENLTDAGSDARPREGDSSASGVGGGKSLASKAGGPKPHDLRRLQMSRGTGHAALRGLPCAWAGLGSAAGDGMVACDALHSTFGSHALSVFSSRQHST